VKRSPATGGQDNLARRAAPEGGLARRAVFAFLLSHRVDPCKRRRRGARELKRQKAPQDNSSWEPYATLHPGRGLLVSQREG